MGLTPLGMQRNQDGGFTPPKGGDIETTAAGTVPIKLVCLISELNLI